MSPKHENFPNAFEALLLVMALFYAEYLVAAALHDAAPLYRMDFLDRAACTTVAGNGLLFSCLLRYRRMGYAELFHAGDRPVLRTLMPLCLPILCMVPALGLSVLAIGSAVQAFFPMSDGQCLLFQRMLSMNVPAVVLVCVLAPVLEEMLFRGIILRGFLALYSRPVAILGSAVLFGLAHLNIYQFPVALIIGVVAGWLYERTRSLWPGIVLHGAFNASSVFFEAGMAGHLQSKGYWLLMFLLAAAGMIVLQRRLEPAPKRA